MMDLPGPNPLLSTGIQGFGSLIACDLKLEEITHVSGDIAGVFALAPDDLLAAPLKSVAPRELMHELRNLMSLRHFAASRHFVGRHVLPMGPRDVSVSLSSLSGHVVIEFENASNSQYSADDFSSELYHLARGLREAVDDGKLLKSFATMLRFTTGYDCALVYRFGPNGGEVVTEAGRLGQQQFLGDRLGYLDNLPDAMPETRHPVLHFTADAAEAMTPILTRQGQNDGLDLSHCHLRGAASAEVDALTQMGAGAAMSLPIVMNSGLWGMALLLGAGPQMPTRYLRQLCEALTLVVCDRLEIMGQTTTARPKIAASRSSARPDLKGKSVLIVEDNRLIAADLKLMLMELGFTTAVVCVEEAPALEYLATNKVDLGVLDVNLAGVSTSFEVARKLAELGAPFLFASGYGATADLPDWLGPRPVVLKPASKRDLSACIDELFDAGPVGSHQKQVR